MTLRWICSVFFPWPCNNIACRQTLTSTSQNRYHSLSLLRYAFDLESTNRFCSNIEISFLHTFFLFFFLFSHCSQLFTAGTTWEQHLKLAMGVKRDVAGDVYTIFVSVCICYSHPRYVEQGKKSVWKFWISLLFTTNVCFFF